jgi:hypothetical protein
MNEYSKRNRWCLISAIKIALTPSLKGFTQHTKKLEEQIGTRQSRVASRIKRGGHFNKVCTHTI